MIVIFGGAFQGKQAFARTLFPGRSYREIDATNMSLLVDSWIEQSLPGEEAGEDVWLFTECSTWLQAQAISSEQDLLQILRRIVAGVPPSTIFVVEDIGQGIVPLTASDRSWREQNGRMLQYLAGEADQVFRLLAGIPLCLKGECP